MSKKTLELLGWILFFQFIGFILGLITQENIASWYVMLNKPSLTPPAFVFPIVWSLLYAALAVVGYWLWHNRTQHRIKLAFVFYATQMLMNWIWTPLFFYFHLISLSFIWIILMALFTLITIYLTKDKLTYISLTLIPYFVWLIFAAYLNGAIWMLN